MVTERTRAIVSAGQHLPVLRAGVPTCLPAGTARGPGRFVVRAPGAGRCLDFSPVRRARARGSSTATATATRCGRGRIGANPSGRRNRLSCRNGRARTPVNPTQVTGGRGDIRQSSNCPACGGCVPLHDLAGANVSVAATCSPAPSWAVRDAPRGMAMSDHISWETCPLCRRSAAVGWCDGYPSEFDCVSRCQLTVSELNQLAAKAGEKGHIPDGPFLVSLRRADQPAIGA